MSFFRFAIALGWLATPLGLLSAQEADFDVRVHIEVIQAGGQKAAPHQAAGNVVVWLRPDPLLANAAIDSVAPGHFRMEQKNKSFDPHLLVVPLGSTVEFPNLDPFFHNVFSQFNGKRFDLGLYEAGSNRVVRFDHEGVSYLFCNIHSQMAAVIVTVRTPYFAVATGSGEIELHHVPAGDYQVHVWAEGADAHQLDSLTRRVHIAAGQLELGTIQVSVPGTIPQHKNKFGEDYKPDPVQSY
jgi:plastocyanin